MQANAAFGALADPTRMRIVEALASQPLAVNEIVARFAISQPSISRHLRVLRDAGLVKARQNGRERVYRLDPRPLRKIDRWLDDYRHFWADKLDALERHMDAHPTRGNEDETTG